MATCGVLLRVRCGLHAGVVEHRDNDYFGSAVNRAARIMSAPNNLPQQATSVIGRDKELQELKRVLARTRLLTLTGSGGCGKTREGTIDSL